jgi:haloalkane dehalogenase
MIHGNPTWSFYFRSLIRSLSPQFRVVAPDHLGCGLSDKPETTRYDYRLRSRINDLEAFIDHLGFNKKITLVVHDWGGVIGLAYAVKHPEKTKPDRNNEHRCLFSSRRQKNFLSGCGLVRNVWPLAHPGSSWFQSFCLRSCFYGIA